MRTILNITRARGADPAQHAQHAQRAARATRPTALGRVFGLGIALASGLATLLPATAQAGVFNLYHFVPNGRFAIGMEPELTLTNGAGFGVNLKYTHGITDLNNVTAIIGTGGGPRRFRVGANATFDLFPDLESQPGIGIAAQALYYRFVSTGALEVTAIPYLHKSFVTNGKVVEPFIAVPVGASFSNGLYTGITSLSVGSMFKQSDNLSFVVELGVAINNSDSYFSGGIIYYY